MLEKLAWKIRALEDVRLLELIAERGIRKLLLDWSALNEFNSESRFNIGKACRILGSHEFEIDSFHSIHGPGFDLGEAGCQSRPRALALHKHAIEAASEWGAGSVVFHIAGAFSEAARSAACRSIESLLPLARKRGVVMSLENMKAPYYGANSGEITYFIDRFASRSLMACFDAGHANISGGVFSVMDKFAGRIAAVHVHDNFGRADEHLPLGMGNIPWEKVLRRLSEAGYKKIFSCESRPSPGMTWEQAIDRSVRTFEDMRV